MGVGRRDIWLYGSFTNIFGYGAGAGIRTWYSGGSVGVDRCNIRLVRFFVWLLIGRRDCWCSIRRGWLRLNI